MPTRRSCKIVRALCSACSRRRRSLPRHAASPQRSESRDAVPALVFFWYVFSVALPRTRRALRAGAGRSSEVNRRRLTYGGDAVSGTPGPSSGSRRWPSRTIAGGGCGSRCRSRGRSRDCRRSGGRGADPAGLSRSAAASATWPSSAMGCVGRETKRVREAGASPLQPEASVVLGEDEIDRGQALGRHATALHHAVDHVAEGLPKSPGPLRDAILRRRRPSGGPPRPRRARRWRPPDPASARSPRGWTGARRAAPDRRAGRRGSLGWDAPPGKGKSPFRPLRESVTPIGASRRKTPVTVYQNRGGREPFVSGSVSASNPRFESPHRGGSESLTEGGCVAERGGFQTPGSLLRTHAFQACSLSHSDTLSGRRGILQQGAGWRLDSRMRDAALRAALPTAGGLPSVAGSSVLLKPLVDLRRWGNPYNREPDRGDKPVA